MSSTLVLQCSVGSFGFLFRSSLPSRSECDPTDRPKTTCIVFSVYTSTHSNWAWIVKNQVTHSNSSYILYITYLETDPPYCTFVSSCPRWSRPKNITLSLLIYDPFGDPRTKLKTTLFFASIFLNLLHSVILCILLF